MLHCGASTEAVCEVLLEIIIITFYDDYSSHYRGPLLLGVDRSFPARCSSLLDAVFDLSESLWLG